MRNSPHPVDSHLRTRAICVGLPKFICWVSIALREEKSLSPSSRLVTQAAAAAENAHSHNPDWRRNTNNDQVDDSIADAGRYRDARDDGNRSGTG